MLGQILGGVASGLSGLFGGSKSSTQTTSFETEGTTKTDANSQDLSPELLAALEGLFTGLLSQGGMDLGREALGERLNQVRSDSFRPAFDPEEFTRGVMASAASNAGLDLESGINDMLTASAGGGEKENSASALLANRLRTQTMASLAGTEAQTRAQGEEIRTQQQAGITSDLRGLSGDLSSQILGIIEATRGANMTGTSTTHEKKRGTSTTSGKASSKDPFGGIADMFGSFVGARGDA